MRALIIATGYHPELEPLVNYRPSPLLLVVDKPVIFHIIEALVRQGIKKIDLILHHLPEQIEQELECGKRWGITICCHLVKDPDRPFSMIKTLSKRWEDTKILIGQGDILPLLPDLAHSFDETATLFYNKDQWTGWGIVRKSIFKTLSIDSPFHALLSYLGNHRKTSVETLISSQNLTALVHGNLNQLSKEKPDILFPTTAVQVEPSVWISRGVVIEPGAIILPPVFIGIHAHIRSGSTIGPNAIIEHHAMIGNHSRIENSLICQNSYIGENLEIKRCVIDRNSLINLEHGTSLTIQEQFILSDTSLPSFRKFLFALIERGLALFFLIVLSPILLLLWTICEKKQEEMLVLPASESPHKWETAVLTSFVSSRSVEKFFRRLPFLWEIVKGRLHFIGITPRQPREVKKMPMDWMKLYLRSKIGLITLASIDYGTQATNDEQYASEAYYAVHMGFLFDCKLFMRWLLKKLFFHK